VKEVVVLRRWYQKSQPWAGYQERSHGVEVRLWVMWVLHMTLIDVADYARGIAAGPLMVLKEQILRDAWLWHEL
jgi:hypothetical protein